MRIKPAIAAVLPLGVTVAQAQQPVTEEPARAGVRRRRDDHERRRWGRLSVEGQAFLL
jgi:hypothetical protein